MSGILSKTLGVHAPEKIALVEKGFQVTYGDLPDLVLLRSDKLEGYHCVALAMNNEIEWILWDLAALSAGVAVVPLPPFFTIEQREHAMKSSGCDAIVTPDGVIALPYSPVALPKRVAKITYTSGTTAAPKGVCLSETSMENVAQGIVDVLGRDMAGLHACVLPLGVLLENVAGVYATLFAGGTVYLSHLEMFGRNYENLRSVLNDAGATSVILVPEILRLLMGQIVQSGPVPSLRYIAVGGSKVSPALTAQARLMGLPVYEGYGLSECASVVCLNAPADDRAGTVGKFLPHIKAAFRDGEIIIGNTGFLGYVGERAPLEIRTGDLGVIDADGFVSINGRSKNVLITSYGRNVSPEWVESELLSEPEIAQAMVYGDGESSLSAYIVPTRAKVDVKAAVSRANARLPDYAQVKDFTFVPPFSPEDGTLTGTGRPRRSRILQIYQKEKIHDVL